MQFQPGGTVGSYRLVRLLGRGAMGAVFEAEDTRTGRRTALKVLIAPSERGRERFRREGKVLRRLRHPNVVFVHEVGEADGACFLSLELVEGESLEERLRSGPLPWQEAVRVCALVARGLEQAHAIGILHRDLKPGNVLLSRGGRALLTDFGLAKDGRAEYTLALTQQGQLVGTPAYMSPEQLAGDREVDARADIYGLGATLFAALTGRPPFEGTLIELAVQIASDAPPAASTLTPGLPPALDAIVARCLEKEPDARYGSVTELALALEADLERPAGRGRTRRAGRDAPTAEPRDPVVLALAGLVVIGVLVLGVVAAWRAASTPEEVEAELAQSRAPVTPPGSGRTLAGTPSPTATPSPTSSPSPKPAPRPTRSKPPPPPAAPRGFRFLRRQSFSAGGQTHAVAVFRCEAFAGALGLRKFESRPECEFVLVPGGTFLLGSPRSERSRYGYGDREGPQRQVEVQPFLLARTEMPQRVWEGLHGPRNQSHKKGPFLPLDRVTWNEAVRFLHAVHLRLPSEAEWEYAARSGTTTAYAFGETIDPRVVNYEGVRGGPSTVGSFPTNAFGLFDMHGNVWEWCQDALFTNHRGAPGKAWPARPGDRNAQRVIRGGCWKHDAGTSRSANRTGYGPTQRFFVVGFRAARSYP